MSSHYPEDNTHKKTHHFHGEFLVLCYLNFNKA